MNYCGPKGIPLSTFLSWPIDDQEAALWWQAESNLHCGECGTAPWEWEADPDAYGVEEFGCRGCAMLRAAQKKADEKPTGMSYSRADLFPGLKIRLIKLPRPND
jgi:hypothetical protein